MLRVFTDPAPDGTPEGDWGWSVVEWIEYPVRERDGNGALIQNPEMVGRWHTIDWGYCRDEDEAIAVGDAYLMDYLATIDDEADVTS